MELTKQDNQMAKGLAILGMILLHLFCRVDNLPYTPLIWIGTTPLIYYFGLFGDLCVPVYCFCSGYAQSLLYEKNPRNYRKDSLLHLFKFLINYWVVLFVFTIVGVIFDHDGLIPGSLDKFIGNFLLYNISYNGAWWFVLTYTILIIVTPLILKIVNNLQFKGGICFISGVIYFVAYLFRFVVFLEFDNTIIAHIWEQLLLLGTSQFSFVLGCVCYNKRLVSNIRQKTSKTYWKNIICILLPMIMFVIHGIERSLIIAPITGLTTMFCFHIIDKPKWVEAVFLYLGKHSTNIWLVHMFFYLFVFKNLVFVVKYPILIIIFMFLLCLPVSWLINLIVSFIYNALPMKGYLYAKNQCNRPGL